MLLRLQVGMVVLMIVVVSQEVVIGVVSVVVSGDAASPAGCNGSIDNSGRSSSIGSSIS